MARRRRSILALGLIFSSVVPIFSATGSETVNYTYDTQGRLVKVARSGTVNNGVSACYAYDKADNRSNVTVATSSDCASGGGGGETPPSFAIGNTSVTEGGNLVFTVTKTGTVSQSYSVNYATANGTAAAGSDYTAKSGTLTFTSAQTSLTVSVATTNDTTVESAETVLVNLSAATGGATISDTQGVGTINDNDTPAAPSFSINDAFAIEGGSLTFTVTKTGTTSSSFSVNYATADGTATSAGDYFAASGTLTFAPADTSKTITILTQNNSQLEATENFAVNLSGATGGATVSDAQGIGTIEEDDDGNPMCGEFEC